MFKTYISSVRYPLFSCISMLILTGSQLAINVYYERVFLIVFFGAFFIGYLIYTILLTADLVTKNVKLMIVQILHIENRIILVNKPNGKARRIRITKSEIGKYEVNQQLMLTLTKRTGMILDVKTNSERSTLQ